MDIEIFLPKNLLIAEQIVLNKFLNRLLLSKKRKDLFIIMYRFKTQFQQLLKVKDIKFCFVSSSRNELLWPLKRAPSHHFQRHLMAVLDPNHKLRVH